MTSFLKSTLYILGGAAIGGGVSYLFISRRYQKKCKEIQDLVEEADPFNDDGLYDDLHEEVVVPVNKSIEKPDIRELVNGLDEPYLISESAIDYEDYNYDDEVAYTYYSDGILADENDEVITDAQDILPSGWLDCFGYGCSCNDKFYAVNPRLRLLMEVVRTDEPYLEE